MKLSKLYQEAIGYGAVEDLMHLLQPTDRIHLSEKPIEKLSDLPGSWYPKDGSDEDPLDYAISNKPSGLWYSFGASWLNSDYGAQLAAEKYQYMYEIVVPEQSILEVNKYVIKDIETDFGLTDKQYKFWSYPKDFGGLDRPPMDHNIWKHVRSKYPKARNEECTVLFWPLIYRKFVGIEVPRLHEVVTNDNWLYGWDASSGCVWDTSNIKLNLIFGPNDLKHDKSHDYSDEEREALYKKLYGDD